MRLDLLRYENYICYVTNEVIYLVARHETGAYDVLTIDRTTRIEHLQLKVLRFNDESQLGEAMPFAFGSIGALSKTTGGRFGPKKDPTPAAEPKQTLSVQRVFNAYGVVGFVRFLYGYYVIIISERSQVATVGHHAVHKIDRLEIIYIPMPQIGLNDANEMRYLKTFQNVDLTAQYYLSYTYDITRTMQSWLDCAPAIIPFDKSFDVKYTWNSYLVQPMSQRLDEAALQRWIIPLIHGYVGQGKCNIFGRQIYVTVIARRSRYYAGTRYLKRGISSEGYVANEVETEQIVFENPSLALVEMPESPDGVKMCSSFVQMRGSVPALWTQDLASMSMGPPPIAVYGHDLGMLLAGRHFSQLLKRYGAPIVVLDLVKTSQKANVKRPAPKAVPTNPNNPNMRLGSSSEAQKEALLHEVIIEAVNYLNQYIEPKLRIQYIHIDLAHIYRRDATGAVTVRRLLEIGERALAACGLCYGASDQRQTGVVRTNCVDCLDRTNAAQLAVGLVALGHQFHALGATSQPIIELDSYCFRLFELLFEEMGDILALQYGGSLLVHHFATYRRAAPWISQSRDKLEQLSRLLNNTFSDAERQHGKNLLLGIFRPYEHHRGTTTAPGQALWELSSDYELHNPVNMLSDSERRRRLVQWFDLQLLKRLPLPEAVTEFITSDNKLVRSPGKSSPDLKTPRPVVDSYTTFFQPNRLTFFEDTVDFKLLNSIQLTPGSGVALPDSDLDPFIPRTRRVGTSTSANPNAGAGSMIRRWLQYNSGEQNEQAAKLPTPLIKQSSSDSFDASPLGTSAVQSDSDDSVDGDYVVPDASSIPGVSRPVNVKSPWPSNNFSTVFKSQRELFGCSIGDGSFYGESERKLFYEYCYMSDFKPVAGVNYRPLPIEPKSSKFRSDLDFLNVEVSEDSKRIYEAYVRSSPGVVSVAANGSGSLWEPEDRSQEYISYMQMGQEHFKSLQAYLQSRQPAAAAS